MQNHTGGMKRSVRFSDVTVYYFQRIQGFVCVPGDPGVTLGMKDIHACEEKFSLARHDYLKDWEDEREERQIYKRFLEEGNPHDPDYQWKLNMLKNKNKVREKSPIYPLSPRQRAFKLRTAGVEIIDPSEKDDIASLKDSRVFCGCNCVDGCSLDCPCSASGVPCQVERYNESMSYPCNCGKLPCQNESGRLEFDVDGIKDSVRNRIERLRIDSENPETLEEHIDVEHDKTTHQYLFSIIMNDFDYKTNPDFTDEVYPLNEVYCSDTAIQELLSGLVKLDCEVYDCGCYKQDTNIELCPNCTCQPMDVVSTPEKGKVIIEDEEDHDDTEEEQEEFCTGCSQKPCSAITNMTIDFNELDIGHDTCERSTMTVPWPWYEDLEEVITGEKGPSAMSVDPSTCRKRIFEESDVGEEYEAQQNDFQKSFQSFIINSRRKVNAVIRSRLNQRTKESEDQTFTHDAKPLTVPSTEDQNSDSNRDCEKKEKLNIISTSDFTLLKPFASTLNENRKNVSVSSSLDSCDSIAKDCSSSSNCMSEFVLEASKSTDMLDFDIMAIDVEDDKTKPFFNADNLTTPTQKINYSANKLRPRIADRQDLKCRSIENFLKNSKSNNTPKRTKKSDSSSRNSILQTISTQLEVPSSSSSTSSCLDSDSSSRSNSPVPTDATSKPILTPFSPSSEYPVVSAANFMSDLRSLTSNIKSSFLFETTPPSQYCNRLQASNSKLLLFPTFPDVPNSLLPQSSSSQDLTTNHKSLPIPPNSISHSKIVFDSSKKPHQDSEFLRSIMEPMPSKVVFKQSTGLWKSSDDESKVHLVSLFMHSIRSRMNSKGDWQNEAIPTKILNITRPSTLSEQPFRTI